MLKNNLSLKLKATKNSRNGFSNMDKALSLRTKSIAEYFISNPKLTQKEIAAHFGLSIGRISQILRNPRVTNQFPILARRVVRERILPKALQAYERLIEKSSNDAVVEKAAGRVLASEKVFENENAVVINQIDIKNVFELKQLVDRAHEVPLNVIDTDIVEEK